MSTKIIVLLACLTIGLSSFTLNDSYRAKKLKRQKLFISLLSHFPNVDTPLEIGISDLNKVQEKYNSKNTIYNQTDFIPRQLSNKFLNHKLRMTKRIPPAPITPLARFYVDENHIAVISASIPFRGAKEFMSVNLNLFDLRGNSVLIGDKQTVKIAGYSPESTEIVSFKNKKEYAIESFQNVWKEDYVQSKNKNNHIIKYEPLSISHASLDQLIPAIAANPSIASANP